MRHVLDTTSWGQERQDAGPVGGSSGNPTQWFTHAGCFPLSTVFTVRAAENTHTFGFAAGFSWKKERSKRSRSRRRTEQRSTTSSDSTFQRLEGQRGALATMFTTQQYVPEAAEANTSKCMGREKTDGLTAGVWRAQVLLGACAGAERAECGRHQAVRVCVCVSLSLSGGSGLAQRSRRGEAMRWANADAFLVDGDANQ